jgi:hypothetical protein
MSRAVTFEKIASVMAAEIWLRLQSNTKGYIVLNEDMTDDESDWGQLEIAKVLVKHGALVDPEKPAEEIQPKKKEIRGVSAGHVSSRIKMRKKSKVYHDEIGPDLFGNCQDDKTILKGSK